MTRRMFSDEITKSDAFLDMPQGSQALYFHLGMSADDDGFVGNPRMTMRILRSTDDEMKILLAKKFLLQFESGVCVVKHWRINNYLRKDVYHETKYTKEKSLIFIRPNGSYTLTKSGAISIPKGHFTLKEQGEIDVHDTYTSRIESVHLDKVRLDKVRLDKNTMSDASDSFIKFWEKYPKKELKKKSQEIWKRKKFDTAIDEILTFIEKAKSTDRWKKGYVKQAPAFLNGECWNDDIESYNDRKQVITKSLKIS